MKTFSLVYLAVCIAFADALFPYSTIALAGWVVVSLAVMAVQRKINEHA
jgi:hypothetical protein